MHKHIRSQIAAFVCFLFLTSCYSDPEDALVSNATRVTIATITLDSSLPSYQDPAKTTVAEGEILPDIRFVICAYTQEGELQDRKLITLNNNTGQTSYPVNATFYLPPGKYRFTFWTDYVAGGSVRDWFYDTQDLQEVLYKLPYSGNTDLKDAYTGYKDFDLSNSNGVEIKEDITLQRPFAKYRIIANDLKEYIRIGGSDITGITATIDYSSNTYNSFDVYENRATDRRPGHSFVGNTEVLSDSQLLIAWDYIWSNEEELTLKANITLRNRSGQIINTVTGIEIPYLRNRLTTITGAFLTEEQESGIGVITEYEGDIDVPLP